MPESAADHVADLAVVRQSHRTCEDSDAQAHAERGLEFVGEPRIRGEFFILWGIMQCGARVDAVVVADDESSMRGWGGGVLDPVSDELRGLPQRLWMLVEQSRAQGQYSPVPRENTFWGESAASFYVWQDGRLWRAPNRRCSDRVRTAF